MVVASSFSSSFFDFWFKILFKMLNDEWLEVGEILFCLYADILSIEVVYPD